jgi:drug/metabolite transporter (DMT)-like permease
MDERGAHGARRRATLAGALAVLLWATLALLTEATGRVPPFQLTAMTFGLAFALALLRWLARGDALAARLRLPAAAWAVGVGGLFGYHAAYFLALRLAPAVEASLIAYLWPLLIVVLSAALPGERLLARHVAGALLGLAGAALIVLKDGAAFRPEHAGGHAAALACAFIWALYSLASRRLKAVSSEAVGGYCGATAALALAAHLAFETTAWPQDAVQWAAVAALGLGPVGAAFFVWDYGVKHGDIQALGAFSYAAPLLSTGLLVAAGASEPTWRIGLACLLIAGGAALAASDLLVRRGS